MRRELAHAVLFAPQVACFDTAFHHTQPEIAAAYALPRWITDQGVRRYGFHGLSYEYIASVLPDVLGPVAADGLTWPSSQRASANTHPKFVVARASKRPGLVSN
jgi:hypothetical protein